MQNAAKYCYVHRRMLALMNSAEDWSSEMVHKPYSHYSIDLLKLCAFFYAQQHYFLY